MQPGNSRKELGDCNSALQAFDTAIGLDDREPNVRLQKGHALKLARMIPEAIASYRFSVELTRRDKNPAALELATFAPEELAVENRHAYAPRLGDARDGAMATEGHQSRRNRSDIRSFERDHQLGGVVPISQ